MIEEKPRIVCSIDPGLSGVICVRNPRSKIIKTFPAPFVMHKERYARLVIDREQWEPIVETIYELADEIGAVDVTDKDEEKDRLFVMIEAPAIHGGFDSRIAVSGIHWYSGCLDTAFRLEGWNAQIEYIRPQQWQQAILDPFIISRGYPRPKGEGLRARWKQLSIEYVRENYGPEVLKFARGRKENDNIADSICISEYASKIYLGELPLVRSWVYTPREKWKNVKGSKPNVRSRRGENLMEAHR